MKILSLNKNVFSIQKCLLPDCAFLRENYGRYCLVTEKQSKFIVKIGLCEIKCVDSVIFLDDSVSVYSSLEKIRRIDCIHNIDFDNLVILNKPTLAKVVKVKVIFANIFDVKKYENSGNTLEKIVKEILRLYVFCSNSVVFLSNLLSNQKYGINCILIENADESKDYNKIFKVDSRTEIIVEKCMSQLKFSQSLREENEVQLGGCRRVYEIIKEAVEFLKCLDNKKVKLVNKLLLIGPPGSGKTTLVHNVTRECKCILLEISACDVNSVVPEEVEKKLTSIFLEAKIYAESNECCVVLIEDIDLICSGRSTHAKRFVGKLITLLEDIEDTTGILVIATTNSPDEVNLQLRRPRRLEDELEITIPTMEERVEILDKILNYFNMKCSENLLQKISHWTPGFVGADLRLIVTEALLSANKKNHLLQVTEDFLESYFKEALKKVIPSALKGTVGLCMTKTVTFEQIGGLESIKKVLDLSVKQQLENPKKFQKLGIPLTKGILLYGPPGCAKTTLVKALAKECNTTFIATSAADLYSPFVGDAEKKIVQLFTQARIGSPSILFIDEIDAVVGSKSGDRERGVQERILSTLLIEMDGVGLKVNTQKDSSLRLLGETKEDTSREKETNNGVIVIGATNRPQLLDDALKRPGRFDRLLYVPPPDERERLRILKKLTERMPLHDSVDLQRLAERTNYYSGADLKNLCQESGLHALHSSDMSAESIRQSHFDHVLSEYKPSLSEKVIDFYESFQKFNV